MLFLSRENLRLRANRSRLRWEVSGRPDTLPAPCPAKSRARETRAGSVGPVARNEKRIYVDFDDVLCETARILVHIADKEFGRQKRFEEIESFDISESFALDETETARMLDRLHDPEVLESMPIVEGSAAALGHWVSLGYKVDVVTGRPASTRIASTRWLERHGLPFSSLIFVDKYSRSHAEDSAERSISVDELRERDYRLAVDDAPEMIAILEDRLEMPVVVLDRPWNRGPALPAGVESNIHRCADWQQIMDRFPSP